ncbi:fatty acyl-AMP ligase [Rhizohabitans arisaemae]|uniref:fatty acyl-AMP ligase n=1 Tax=Rhizohabitans arisaemae TaxID=2720610 RepID=UPI0024B1842B|nr:fatty acyl-AMP ligase [Rhizohabitans arisaemae]
MEVARHRVAAHGDSEALRFLAGTESVSLTYAELDDAARRTAVYLRGRLPVSGGSGERVLLLYPAGVDFAAGFLGSLYAGAVAVPAPMPEGHRSHVDRLRRIIADSGARVVLTDRADVEEIASAFGGAVTVQGTDDLADVDPGDWRAPELSGDSLALLQYTSGSTNDPKGVMVTHANLLHNIAKIHRELDITHRTAFAGWLPFFHDMGLIGQLLTPLLAGGRLVFMSPIAFVKRPHLWLKAIHDHGADIAVGPDFGYDLCVRRVTDTQAAGLDLSRWTAALNGSEPISARTLRRFAERFAPAGLRPEALHPCYGLAEASLYVTGDRRGRLPVIRRVDPDELELGRFVPVGPETVYGRELVGSGVVGDYDLLIVDPGSGEPLPDGRVGEIWLRGGSVARGYWRNARATRETFRNTASGGQTGYLRTGDLGVVHEGELYVTGRLKDLIIVHGRNLYPQDIEAAVRAVHPALAAGAGAVFQMPEPEQELVVVQEAKARELGDTTAEELIARIKREIGREFGVGVAQVVLVRSGQVPRTTSGKVQRSLTRGLLLTGSLEPAATTTVKGI